MRIDVDKRLAANLKALKKVFYDGDDSSFLNLIISKGAEAFWTEKRGFLFKNINTTILSRFKTCSNKNAHDPSVENRDLSVENFRAQHERNMKKLDELAKRRRHRRQTENDYPPDWMFEESDEDG